MIPKEVIERLGSEEVEITQEPGRLLIEPLGDGGEAGRKIDGRPLIEQAAEYSRKWGRSSGLQELEAYKGNFLSYLHSNGKADAEDPFLRMSVEDTQHGERHNWLTSVRGDGAVYRHGFRNGP